MIIPYKEIVDCKVTKCKRPLVSLDEEDNHIYTVRLSYKVYEHNFTVERTIEIYSLQELLMTLYHINTKQNVCNS